VRRRRPGSASPSYPGESAPALVVRLKAQVDNKLLRDPVAAREIGVLRVDSERHEVFDDSLLAPLELASPVGIQDSNLGLLSPDVVDEGAEQTTRCGLDTVTIAIRRGTFKLSRQGQERFMAKRRCGVHLRLQPESREIDEDRSLRPIFFLA
jgi:hypothetical protein